MDDFLILINYHKNGIFMYNFYDNLFTNDIFIKYVVYFLLSSFVVLRGLRIKIYIIFF